MIARFSDLVRSSSHLEPGDYPASSPVLRGRTRGFCAFPATVRGPLPRCHGTPGTERRPGAWAGIARGTMNAMGRCSGRRLVPAWFVAASLLAGCVAPTQYRTSATVFSGSAPDVTWNHSIFERGPEEGGPYDLL